MLVEAVLRSEASAELDPRCGAAAALPCDASAAATRARLERARERVGEVKARCGEDAWRTAVHFCDPYARLPEQRRVCSRAYFKWVELAPLVGGVNGARVAHLCEAPGGFAQASRDMGCAAWCAHSLDPLDGRSAPSTIRFKRKLLFAASAARGHILDGLVAGGDLLDDAAVDDLTRRLRARGPFDVVTADGCGADHESDHVHAEERSLRLAVREAVVARRVLRTGGSFVLKLLAVTTVATASVIQLLTDWFEVVRLAKPRASRASNGERYCVCLGKRPVADDRAEAARLLAAGASEGAVAGGASAIASLYPTLDPRLARGLGETRAWLAQLQALEMTCDVCSGRGTPQRVDRTDEWWRDHAPASPQP